jgi:hypothetical protein
VSNCTFRRNSGLGGGAIYNYMTDEYKITNCIFCYNSATDTSTGRLTERRGGGAIFNDRAANPIITSCVFYRNRVTARGWGAAIYHYWGDVMKVVNCTFFDNSDATNTRTGLAVEWADKADVANSIVINTSVGDLDGRGPTVFSYSCFAPGSAVSGTGNIFVAPKFVDTAAGDFHLTSASLCIDQASGTIAPALDIEGKARWDHPGCDNADNLFADMGAYEYRPITTDAKPEARRGTDERELGFHLAAKAAGRSVSITCSLPARPGSRPVLFSLFDGRGVRVARREIRPASAGSHTLVIRLLPGQIGTGMYFCRMETGNAVLVEKLFLVR